MGQKSANCWPISGKKKFENFLVIILPKFSMKLAENRPILGPKKPAGLSGFEDRASGGLGPPKKRLGRAGFGLSPRPDPSLINGRNCRLINGRVVNLKPNTDAVRF